jgi:para-nitrobenzyl esterase
MDNIEIITKCGKIKGISSQDCNEFRGIKYANSKRFEYPVQVTSWDGIYDATYFKDCSYQRRAFEDDATVNAFYHKEFREGASFTYSEDCLYLNIWSPKNPNNCPVFIYIHGGSFTGGSSNENHINGTEFAKNGVIFVSINYRLGPFGFCSHPDLKDSEGVCGNYGLFDQYTAIKWIKDNIAEFGGNPNKITLAGQSAGAMSVDIQISNPMCKNWFSGAIMMSGCALQRAVMKPLKPEDTIPFWNVVVKNANVKNVNELKNVDEKTLFYAWLDACENVKHSMKYTFPVYDDKLLVEGNFSMNNIPDMPYILGVTIADMVPVALEGIVKKWADKTAKYKNPCYVYLFARDLPGDNKSAWHSSDLLYAFSTLKYNWRPFENIDYEISNQISKSFYAFAKTSNPNCNAIPKWESGGKRVMNFCENTKFAPFKTTKLIKNTILYKYNFL